MIRAATMYIAGDPAAGPGLARYIGDSACLTSIITQLASPPPAQACLTTIITDHRTGGSACVTGIIQASQPIALRVQNAANVATSMGNPVTHEEISF